ncbi:MAG: glycosyltransferase family 2 protein [Flavobacteriales bacterium]|nr:glycosyltransferase family 2 protein [Flavobacteriales bacterium]
MKIAGFTFIRNAIKNDYPIVEAINSILPICDEFVIAHGNSNDETLELLQKIDSDKIRIIETTWDDTLKEGGRVFAEETNKAFKEISKDMDWAFYIQGDECIHEKYLDTIKKEMQLTLNNPDIEGLLFDYKHFYGSYDYDAHSRRCYGRKIRIVKNLSTIKSYKDAVLETINIEEFDYGNADTLVRYEGTYPNVLKPRIEKSNWKFSFDPTKIDNAPFSKKLLNSFEQITELRLFEYRNYKIVAR